MSKNLQEYIKKAEEKALNLINDNITQVTEKVASHEANKFNLERCSAIYLNTLLEENKNSNEEEIEKNNIIQEVTKKITYVSLMEAIKKVKKLEEIIRNSIKSVTNELENKEKKYVMNEVTKNITKKTINMAKDIAFKEFIKIADKSSKNIIEKFTDETIDEMSKEANDWQITDELAKNRYEKMKKFDNKVSNRISNALLYIYREDFLKAQKKSLNNNELVKIIESFKNESIKNRITTNSKEIIQPRLSIQPMKHKQPIQLRQLRQPMKQIQPKQPMKQIQSKQSIQQIKPIQNSKELKIEKISGFNHYDESFSYV